MNLYRFILFLCIAFNLSAQEKDVEQILETDNLNEFLSLVCTEPDITPSTYFTCALSYNARAIAGHFATQISQEEKNKALWLTIQRSESLAPVQLAVEMGADIHYKPANAVYDTLESALRSYHFDVADFLFGKGSRVPKQVPYHPNRFATPQTLGIIHSIVLSNLIENHRKCQVIKWLIDHGYDPDDAGTMRRTPLFDAGHPEIVQLLCQSGADPNILNQHGMSPLYKLNGETPKKALKTAISLILFGANIHYQHPENKQNVLHVAITRNLTDVAAYLLIKGANKQCKNSEGQTPLDLAKDNPDLYTMLASDLLPSMPADALQIERKLSRLKQKIG